MICSKCGANMELHRAGVTMSFYWCRTSNNRTPLSGKCRGCYHPDLRTHYEDCPLFSNAKFKRNGSGVKIVPRTPAQLLEEVWV
jgi:hypothetical protein